MKNETMLTTTWVGHLWIGNNWCRWAGGEKTSYMYLLMTHSYIWLNAEINRHKEIVHLPCKIMLDLVLSIAVEVYPLQWHVCIYLYLKYNLLRCQFHTCMWILNPLIYVSVQLLISEENLNKKFIYFFLLWHF